VTMTMLSTERGGCVLSKRTERTLFMGSEMRSCGRSHRAVPGCHLHDNAVAVEVGLGSGSLGGRHVD
jgi:hypothetical protein